MLPPSISKRGGGWGKGKGAISHKVLEHLACGDTVLQGPLIFFEF